MSKKLRKAVKRLLAHLKGAGSPRHGHQVPGRWDGDSRHAAGSICKECRRYDKLRELVK